MPNRYQLLGDLYQSLFKPVAFSLDAEFVHDSITQIGELLENQDWLLGLILGKPISDSPKKVLGITFPNPIGLSAGFDYDGHLAKVMQTVGFGFNTIGTVTANAYEGNPKPRLGRLPKSQSLLVNKGFKSEGAQSVAARLDAKDLSGHTIGISVGSTNRPEVNTIRKAINDYLVTFDIFKSKSYVSYFELNISCPNTSMPESFTKPDNFIELTKAVKSLKLKPPIFVKMPNEISDADSDKLVDIALKQGIRGFIFSNLVKNRANSAFNPDEIKHFANFKGNFSGSPAFANSNRLLVHTRKKFAKNVALIGCGGVFTIEDVLAKFSSGADLIQLITGLIFQGPQLPSTLASDLVKQDI